MDTMASIITSLTIINLTGFSSQIKENIKSPCPLTGEFPAQMASDVIMK